jgi:hypothetical protein
MRRLDGRVVSGIMLLLAGALLLLERFRVLDGPWICSGAVYSS